ncbi:hypothetical protein, partial [Escherichia coli]|uniref:hypothetical protein n=1 Tax=Escherichia coli TaxID=562 RepID=UPI00403E88D7
MTLRFRAGVGWMVMNVWQGNFPVMQATQSRHATPFAQVQQMITDAKITQVDWSNVVNKPNVAIQNTAPVFTAISLINPTTPFMDFYYGGQQSNVDARIIAGAANSLSIFTNANGANQKRPLYMDGSQALFGVQAHMGQGGLIPSGQQLVFSTVDQTRPLYNTNHDINNWVLYGLTDGVPQVPFAMVNFSRGSGAATFYSRPSWAGLIP